MRQLSTTTEPAPGMGFSWGSELYQVNDVIRLGDQWLVMFDNVKRPGISFQAQMMRVPGPDPSAKCPEHLAPFVEALEKYEADEITSQELVTVARECGVSLAQEDVNG